MSFYKDMTTELKEWGFNINEINDSYDPNANNLEDGNYGDEENNSYSEDEYQYED